MSYDIPNYDRWKLSNNEDEQRNKLCLSCGEKIDEDSQCLCLNEN